MTAKDPKPVPELPIDNPTDKHVSRGHKKPSELLARRKQRRAIRKRSRPPENDIGKPQRKTSEPPPINATATPIEVAITQP